MNIVDLIIVIFIISYVLVGFSRGLLRQVFDLIVLITAFVLAFRFYHVIGDFVVANLRIASNFRDVIGFFVIWFVVEFVYYILFILFYEKIPEKYRESKINKWGGVFPSLIRGVLTIWILLVIVSLLPLPKTYFDKISSSFLGGKLVKVAPTVERQLGTVFGGAIDETVNFLTVKTDSGESIDLGYKTINVTVDTGSENRMLDLINQERTSRGLKVLVMDQKLQEVARAHSKDMFAKGYFAHNNLDGLTPFDRMDKVGIKYFVAGENLALAPDVQTAHTGLMNSPGHRANILTADFGKVGIGVIDGGKYGKMFSQEFTD